MFHYEDCVREIGHGIEGSKILVIRRNLLAPVPKLWLLDKSLFGLPAVRHTLQY